MEPLEMQAFKAMIAEKCREALAPLYAELEELKAEYNDLKQESSTTQTEPTPQPTQEEEDAKFMAMLQRVKKDLQASGRLPKDN